MAYPSGSAGSDSTIAPVVVVVEALAGAVVPVVFVPEVVLVVAESDFLVVAVVAGFVVVVEPDLPVVAVDLAVLAVDLAVVAVDLALVVLVVDALARVVVVVSESPSSESSGSPVVDVEAPARIVVVVVCLASFGRGIVHVVRLEPS
jgi:hypothetical protein